MQTGSCNRCGVSASATITAANRVTSICSTHAALTVAFIDDLIADGMESFSPESTERCPKCLIPFTEERAIRIAIGAWRRHALCLMFAEPILNQLAVTQSPASSS